MNEKERPLPPCGNPKCRCSTGIHDGITFGSGRLDRHGYWEFPCAICARNFDSKQDERVADFKARWLADAAHAKTYFDNLSTDEQEAYLKKGYDKPVGSEEAQQLLDKYLKSSGGWLFDEAWPFADQDVAKLIENGKEYFAREAKEDEEFEAALADMGLTEEEDE